MSSFENRSTFIDALSSAVDEYNLDGNKKIILVRDICLTSCISVLAGIDIGIYSVCPRVADTDKSPRLGVPQ